MTKSPLPLLLLVLTIACQNSARETTAQPAARSVESAPVVDTWERSRQCVEHADRIVGRFQREAANDSRAPSVMEWSNHYNRKEGRCYVVIAFFDPTAKEKKGYAPLTSRQLYDAVEGLLIAEHTRHRLIDKMSQDLFCRIPDPSGDRSTTGANCEDVHKFIVEKMTQ